MSYINRVKIWFNVIYSLFATWRGVKSNILSAEETVEVLNQGKSLIRFGDGEFGIYRGKDIHYQKWSSNLKKDFISIKKSFEQYPGRCPYILAIPKHYMQCGSLELCKKRVLASSWAESRLFYKRNFNLNLMYGDSFLFEKANASIYAKLWNNIDDKRTIIFVHNNPSYADEFAKRFKRKVLFVKCPAKDAYAAIEKLLNSILQTISLNDLSINTTQVVISAGPAGKVLVYRLSKAGYSCIDAGHCWDEPLES